MSGENSTIALGSRRATAVAALIALVVSACTTDEADPSATTATASSAAITAPATTAPVTTAPVTSVPVTSVPPATTPAAPTTAPTTAPATTLPPATAAPLTPAGLTLLSDGIGPLQFGDLEPDVVTLLSTVLGAPTETTAAVYPIPVEGVYAVDEFGEERFVHPASSTVCFANGLCAYFGGPAAGSLTLTGWTQDGGPGSLATPEGVTVGSRWNDHLAAMTVDEGGCYSSGSGSTAGIYLWVRSEGIPFLEVLADGTLVTHLPDPADVVVTRLESGDMPYMPFLDC